MNNKKSRRSNAIYWITYCLLLIFFILGALFYRQPFMALIILLLCILPIISAAILFIYGRSLKIYISKHPLSVEVGNNISVNIALDNKTIFPFLNVELFFTFDNHYYSSTPMQLLAMHGAPKKVTIYNPVFKTSKSGMVDISFKDILVTDYLHLFTIHLPANDILHIPVMPGNYELPLVPSLPETFSDDEEVINERCGQLSRDIKDVREYIPGDLLRDIHWKISAKKDDLFIKEYEPSGVRMLRVIPELTKDCLEETLETVVALSKALLKQKEAFKILSYQIGTRDFSESIIDSEDDINAALIKLYYCDSYDMKSAAYSAYIGLEGADANAITVLGREVTIR